MLAIVTISRMGQHLYYAATAISLLRLLMGNEIVAKHENLRRDRDNAQSYYARQAVAEATSSLKRLKLLWAGLQTHQEALQDFLIYRATTSPDVNTNWQVSALCRKHAPLIMSH